MDLKKDSMEQGRNEITTVVIFSELISKLFKLLFPGFLYEVS